MNKIAVYSLPTGLSDIISLNSIESLSKSYRSSLLTYPFAVAFEVLTPLILLSNPVIVLKSVTNGFTPDLAVQQGVSMLSPRLIGSDYLIIELSTSGLSLGANSVTLYMGGVAYTVSFSVVTDIPVSSETVPVVTSAQFSDIISGVSRAVLLVGTDLHNITSVKLDGVAISYTLLNDTLILAEVAISDLSAHSLTAYAGATLKHTSSLQATDSQSDDLEFYHYISGGLLFVVQPVELFCTVTDGSGNAHFAADSIDSIFTALTRQEALFVYYVRDRGGRVVPNTGYQIFASNFSLSGFADANGRISIPLSSLPSVFTLSFLAYDLSYLNQTFSKQ